MLLIIVGFLLVIATYMDMKKHRIPNLISIFVFIIGLLNVILGHSEELWVYIASMLSTFGLFFVLWVSRFLGAGDVKLSAATAVTLAFPETYWFWTMSIGVAVLISIVQIIRHRGVGGITAIFWRLWFKKSYSIEKGEKPLTFPFAPVIALTWMVVIW